MGVVLPHDGNAHAALFRDEVRVDEVDGPGHHGREQARQHGAGDQLRIRLRHRPGELHLDTGEVGRIELHEEASQAVGQHDEGAQLTDRARVRDGDVDAEFHHLTVAEGDDLPRHVHGHIGLSLAGVGAEVRGDDDARVLDEAS